MVAVVVGAMLALVSCGSDAATVTTTASTTTTTAPTAAAPASTVGPSSTAPAGSAPAATQQFTDSTGRTVTIPASPQRIVAIHEYSAGQALLSIGAPVVGLPTRDGTFGPWVQVYDLDGVSPIGEAFEIDLESIAALDPDLIVGLANAQTGQPNEEPAPSDLEAIAPTVYLDQSVPVDEFMTMIGAITGRTGEVAAARTEWEARQREVGADLGAKAKTLSFAFVSGDETGYGVSTEADGNTAIVQLGTQLGLTLPTIDGETDGNGAVTISPEQIPQVDVDFIVWSPFNGDPTSTPLWSTLPAARAGQVFDIAVLPGKTSYRNYLDALAFIEGAVAKSNDVTP